jgi:hypothetical protein
VTNRDGSARTLTWASAEADTTNGRVIRMTVPIRDRRSGSTLEAEAVAEVDGSVEAASHRIAYFGRLVDEYGLERLPKVSAPTAEPGREAREPHDEPDDGTA